MTQYFTVSELTAYLTQVFENDPVLGQSLTVQGEVSNLSKAGSGHVYFTLKDEASALRVNLWAGNARQLKFSLENGQLLFVTGTLDIYAKSGQYNLIAKALEPVGVGALQLAFEQLKAKLEAEGLFETERKRALPFAPQKIGIVTSKTGAVIHDMLRVIARKDKGVSIVLAPAVVQGDGAADSIAQAINTLNHPRYELDAIIVARGGGSFEDLFCFSQEPVVRAIVNSRLPIITGIGHEPDYSLADAAADVRASTPTAAAEQLVLDAGQWRIWGQNVRKILRQHLQHSWQQALLQLDEAAMQLNSAQAQQYEQAKTQVVHITQALGYGINTQYKRHEALLASHAQTLQALNPHSILKRGYAVVQTQAGQVISQASSVNEGEALTLTLAEGQLSVTVQPLSNTR